VCFRIVHTLSGGASFLGMNRLASLAAAFEKSLNSLRKSEEILSEDDLKILFRASSQLSEILNSEMNSKSEIDDTLINDLIRIETRQNTSPGEGIDDGG